MPLLELRITDAFVIVFIKFLKYLVQLIVVIKKIDETSEFVKVDETILMWEINDIWTSKKENLSFNV